MKQAGRRQSIQFPEGLTLRDEANAIVAYAFRTGPIEKLHAGKHSDLHSWVDEATATL